MGVRKTHNRAKTTPSGYNYDDVLKRGKVFHRNSYNGIFEMQPYGGKDGVILWTAERETHPPFTRPKGTRVYKFDNTKRRWVEITEQINN